MNIDQAAPELKTALLALQLYASRHPRPHQVTMTQAGEMLGITRQTVRKLMHAGLLSFNGCGMLPIEQVDEILRARPPKITHRK